MALTRSQRIALIKEISSRLSSENWPLIDLTLREFDLPTEDQWPGNADSYVMAMTNKAGDETLVELAEHCGFQFDGNAKPQGIEPPFWQAGMLKLFVSHLAAHRVEAAAIQSAFLRYGVSCFVAHNDIEPTAEWLAQIETALSTCDSLLAMFHPKFHESQWTDQEVGFAMGRGVPIFAIHYGQAPYGFAGRFQAFVGSGKTPETLAEEVFRTLIKHKQTQRRMAEVAISMFEQSNSFAQAKSRMTYVESLVSWEPSFSTRILQASKSNGQIHSAHGVPERVDALVRQRTPDIFSAELKTRAKESDLDDESPF